ncbi:hypothetical protein RhiirC2_857123 [Rhizophagus irregularis]|uniref:F-box domain-containing protein n=2 Tax=Rhizophagus irregularis TaxID=588596 RepID=A0A2N1ME35_9GLOM|nr:hypothetical protein RhiirC2_857123 [Rhizophagus irregularis]
MACSKIFSGDLPELTNEIIKCLRKDFSTLYSCILVNRLWCRLAIPLLWEDPFCIPTQNYSYIEIYLSYLKEDDKEKFNEYGIINNLLPSNTLLFNYPSLIKYLKTTRICFSVETWVGTLMNDNPEKLKKLVCRSLFEIFLENEGNLHSFEFIMLTDNHFAYFNDTIELILQNSIFTYNIKHLTLQINIRNNAMIIIPLLKFLYSNCSSISSIVFDFHITNDNNRSLIEKCLLQIIISQHNLKRISFGYHTKNLYNPFLSLKNSNCSNTLNTIIFNGINFKNIITILQEVFDQLNVLESIHILYCDSLNSDFVQQIIKVTKPFKLRSLFMNEILHIESLQFLLQKCGDYLENFEILDFGYIGEIYKEQRRQLLKLIMKYCTKIRYFFSDKFDDINIYQLIENIGQTITYITVILGIRNDCDELLSSIVLRNLGQVLPTKLEYLSLTLSFNISDFEIFLRNSQNTFIKKLLIRNMAKDDDKIILSYIKEYIMKKKRVKYLAFSEYCSNDYTNRELFFSDDEVSEFKLHNVIVQKSSVLCISDINDII